MPQYIAFLRGINVGGHRVKMDRLRKLFEELGFRAVSTFIASGNVIFSATSSDADALRESIESRLEKALGYEVATFLRSPAQLAAIAALTPSVAAERGPSRSSHYVIFLRAAASESLRSELAGLSSEMSQFLFSEAEVHWRIQGRLTESPALAGLDRATRALPTTMRNVNTIRRIVAKTTPTEAAQGQL